VAAEWRFHQGGHFVVWQAKAGKRQGVLGRGARFAIRVRLKTPDRARQQQCSKA